MWAQVSNTSIEAVGVWSRTRFNNSRVVGSVQCKSSTMKKLGLLFGKCLQDRHKRFERFLSLPLWRQIGAEDTRCSGSGRDRSEANSGTNPRQEACTG